jgi:adenine deaminase
LLLGTDADGYSTSRDVGTTLVRYLIVFVEAGLTPYQALATGTRNVAEYFGTLDETGTVAVGKRADLVLLDGNPLQNVAYVADPAGVMVGGRWLSREVLYQRLAEVERKEAIAKRQQALAKFKAQYLKAGTPTHQSQSSDGR